ncbi:MAG TPA: alpha/beta fold hydrolase [Aliidongia sp.]|uniref:alpha/beta fold hydrolase n=1 Tax=Aliidongia sp. TaxID=1914230 RepID=UPI002DDCF6D2|nr:alpha/beta fold hydrolase [Aliidongia sp.]HEV2675638.1 alpha/beta fold hydrolase [Aliidongia sp.]
MAHFLLIHGAAHGGWCWHKVVPLLEAAGHHVLAPDLPGLGTDSTPLAELSLDLWVDRLVDLVQAQPQPVVLVGHSRGGLLVSKIAERIPERVERAVYLTAFLLKDGQTLWQEASTDLDSIIPTNLIPDEQSGTWTIRKEVVIDGFYGDCSAEDLDFVFPRLRPEPLFSLHTPIHVTAERFGRIPRHFIECLEDRAITLQAQRRMQAAWPCARVFQLATSHSPFLSAPERLVEVLLAGEAAPAGLSRA